VKDLDAFARRLGDRGHDRQRIGAVVRALTPWAASRDKDAVPWPAIDERADLPGGGEASKLRRISTP